MTRGWLRGIVLACGLLVLAGAARAQEAGEPAGEIPVLLLADEVTYDRELGIVTARGNVEISRGDRVLHADTVSYNEVSRTVTASGNVSLTDESGNTVFAEYVELRDDLKEAAIESIRLLLSDQSRLAAASGRRTGGNVNEFDYAVYSPCRLCAEDPTRAPLWQIKAVKVTYDEAAHTIEYEDAWLEFFGVPVLYTPYFQHPDGTVERASGFLTPRFGYNDDLGAHMQTPYFWAIAPDKDLTVAPIVSTNEYPVLFGTYRQRLDDGLLAISASGTFIDENEPDVGLGDGDFRGHIDATGRFDIDRNWRWGFDLERATDKTYERLFDFSDDRTLTSRAFAEMFDRRNYAAIQGYSFYGTRDTDINDEAPIVAPLFDYNYVSEPVVLSGYFTFDANGMVLSRIDGRDVRRASLNGGWRMPFTSSWGDIYTISATMRADLYSFNDFDPATDDPNPDGPTEDGVAARLFPQLSVEWRYPFVRGHDGWQEIVEPIAAVTAAPNKSNFGDIPNEDSLDIEFDDTNLFDPNRFAGLDEVDTGQRATYGLRWSFVTDEGGYGSLFLGQSYQFNDDVNFATGSGVEDNFSDIVGSVQLSPIEEFDLFYRFRYDANSLDPRRNEVLVSAGPPKLHLNLSYAFLSDEADPNTEFGDREEVAGKISSQFTDYWSGFIAGRYDIESDRVLSYGVGIEYEDECFDIRLSVAREEYQDQERDPNWQVGFSIGLKNLGLDTGG
ncbi:MAG: LPS-assembly protein LptD [Dongiaceae bacterium]